jgi:uncharacterized membrane protein
MRPPYDDAVRRARLEAFSDGVFAIYGVMALYFGLSYVTASDQAAQADSAPDGSSPRRVSRANRYGDPDE